VALAAKILLVAALALVLLPVALVAVFGRAFIYHPTLLTARDLARLIERPGWQLDRLPLGDGLMSRGLVHPAQAPNAPWLLFFGGNAMDLGQIQEILEFLRQDRPWGLAAFAYRGYDGSDGQPTEAALHADARLAFTRLREVYGARPERIVICGESLGTGVAAALVADLKAQKVRVAGLVMVSAYTSIARLVDEVVPILRVGFAIRDPYRTDRRLVDIPGPVLLVHGTADELIDVAHSRALAAAFKDRARLVEVPERGHNDLWLGSTAHAAIQEFVDGLVAGAALPSAPTPAARPATP
jgi:pimeloyl-ACP methyl ester carboxylesterase